MNVKHSLSMNRLSFILPALLISLASASGQTYETRLDRHSWKDSRNINWIRSIEESFSFAELTGGYTFGDYHAPFDADSQWNAGAKAGGTSYLDRFSLIGNFSFENTQMYGATGSMSAVPGYYPVDIYEFTPGSKTRQVYSLAGGISVDLGKEWLLGGSFSYEAQNYTKRKDLRHTTYFMAMEVSPAVLWHRGDTRLGLSCTYSRNTQSISAEELGVSSGVYYAFLDEGLFYGTCDIWDNTSTHLKESGLDRFPVQENGCAIALQAQKGRLYGQLQAGLNSGKTGEKQKLWYNYGTRLLDGRLAYTLSSERALDIFSLHGSVSVQRNRKNILEDITENGITATLNYGSTQVLARGRSDLSLGWERIGIQKEKRMGVLIYYGREESVASVVYPETGTALVQSVGIRLHAQLPLGGRLLAGGTIGLKKGFWEDSESAVMRCEEYYEAMREWKTGLKVPAEAFIRYSFPRGIYLRYNVRFVGHRDGQFANMLSLGYNF